MWYPSQFWGAFNERKVLGILVLFPKYLRGSLAAFEYTYKENEGSIQAAGGNGFCAGGQKLSAISCDGDNWANMSIFV